ncbi:MAG: hypothetical protein UU46_C0029G0010 [Candidatus Uhrbacteria bacterium GW2011_GWD1_41_16]|uniref:Uncharacterized protein n=1 Tax=Candidatus Uhrbacteria bacterium GW2011_GWC1_41_20 TaxID=1618983 RepID=A0A0G0VA29_9BACT|nr:MAG: hypothetical protein UT52_C0023G0013 [Candidatus Uhrbacteria bacterium GW2011_GWE1_39_46]KKR63371.1 MAG: hypothetical protein UU04_C0019G0004 [Candidatus Uhrbacteria bacterium GW2011_GWC2_40_450]KKR94835.1 MAG: hypothetical protein UU46_C0029G0010 [Candidatus Uhrbacteria bacterium GW2011_GWD1_41_16]KKR97858.1 MAG: hypothetical protein UU50_C0023G0004 [Candidatus Uhrbacteria bacterium GW2011_GWC1_41_20]KKS05581.1 MAG: hypothetical protein UU60_C0016G0013 [Candidatus Uhrbacteria bacterium
MSKKEGSRNEQVKEGLDTQQTAKREGGPSTADIDSKASELITMPSAVADIKRFATGSGEKKRRDAGEEEDFNIRKEYYLGWTTEDFKALAEAIDSRIEGRKAEKQLDDDRRNSVIRERGELRRVTIEARAIALVASIDEGTRSEMYQDLIGIDDGDFDSQEFIDKFDLDEEIYGDWSEGDWKILEKTIDEA